MKFKFLSVFVLLMFVASPGFTQGQITVAADSSSGTYDKMLADIISVCSTDTFTISKATNSGGAVGNLQALVENKAQAAFLHSDVYIFNAQSDPAYARFQTLLALYPEPIHVLALKQSKMTRPVSSFGGFRTTNVSVDFSSLSEIDGYKVGAAGGGWVTIRVLKGGGGKFVPTEYPSGDTVLNALNNGEIAAAVFVGAAPLPNLEKLDRSKYKLLTIGDPIAGQLAAYYRPVTINYPGMTNGPLKTIAPLANIMTRKYSTLDKINIQSHFRDCVYKKLPSLQDDASPNWQDVQVNDHGIAIIPWLDLPSSASKSAPAKK